MQDFQQVLMQYRQTTQENEIIVTKRMFDIVLITHIWVNHMTSRIIYL